MKLHEMHIYVWSVCVCVLLCPQVKALISEEVSNAMRKNESRLMDLIETIEKQAHGFDLERSIKTLEVGGRGGAPISFFSFVLLLIFLHLFFPSLISSNQTLLPLRRRQRGGGWGGEEWGWVRVPPVKVMCVFSE